MGIVIFFTLLCLLKYFNPHNIIVTSHRRYGISNLQQLAWLFVIKCVKADNKDIIKCWPFVRVPPVTCGSPHGGPVGKRFHVIMISSMRYYAISCAFCRYGIFHIVAINQLLECNRSLMASTHGNTRCPAIQNSQWKVSSFEEMTFWYILPTVPCQKPITNG